MAPDLNLTAICYSALLSLLGAAMVARYRASNIPDFSIVSYAGLGVLTAGYTVSILKLDLYASPFLALILGSALGAAQ